MSPLVFRQPHVIVNRSTECRKACTSYRNSLWSSTPCQCSTSYTATSDTIPYIILPPVTFYTAFRTSKDSADLAKVFGRGERLFAHIFETEFELGAHWEIGCDNLAREVRAHGGIIAHLYWAVRIGEFK